MNLSKVDIPHVVCRVIVADLTTSPVYTLDLDGFARFDSGERGVFGVPAVLKEKKRHVLE